MTSWATSLDGATACGGKVQGSNDKESKDPMVQAFKASNYCERSPEAEPKFPLA